MCLTNTHGQFYLLNRAVWIETLMRILLSQSGVSSIDRLMLFCYHALGPALLILPCISSNWFVTVCYPPALSDLSLLSTPAGGTAMRMAWQPKLLETIWISFF